jgi:hypothetical protein
MEGLEPPALHSIHPFSNAINPSAARLING